MSKETHSHTHTHRFAVYSVQIWICMQTIHVGPLCMHPLPLRFMKCETRPHGHAHFGRRRLVNRHCLCLLWATFPSCTLEPPRPNTHTHTQPLPSPHSKPRGRPTGARVLPSFHSSPAHNTLPPPHSAPITMVTHHSNPAAAPKGDANASTQFTFLQTYEWSCDEVEHLHDFVLQWSQPWLLEQQKCSSQGFERQMILRCLPQICEYTLTHSYTSLSISVTRMYLPTWQKGQTVYKEDILILLLKSLDLWIFYRRSQILRRFVYLHFWWIFPASHVSGLALLSGTARTALGWIRFKGTWHIFAHVYVHCLWFYFTFCTDL